MLRCVGPRVAHASQAEERAAGFIEHRLGALRGLKLQGRRKCSYRVPLAGITRHYRATGLIRLVLGAAPKASSPGCPLGLTRFTSVMWKLLVRA